MNESETVSEFRTLMHYIKEVGKLEIEVCVHGYMVYVILGPSAKRTYSFETLKEVSAFIKGYKDRLDNPDV